LNSNRYHLQAVSERDRREVSKHPRRRDRPGGQALLERGCEVLVRDERAAAAAAGPQAAREAAGLVADEVGEVLADAPRAG
jgi:hypothetical protein